MNLNDLRPKELAILRGVADGKTHKMIARELGIAPSTIRTHAERARLKMDAITMTQAAVRAKEAGLI